MPTISKQLLQAIIDDMEMRARIIHSEYDRASRRYLWDDKIWERSDPDQFKMMQQARRLIQQPARSLNRERA